MIHTTTKAINTNPEESNLRQMVLGAGAQGVWVVLIGVPKPALFGGNAEFYERIAEALGLPLENEVLNDILKDNSLKSDPVHPMPKATVAWRKQSQRCCEKRERCDGRVAACL